MSFLTPTKPYQFMDEHINPEAWDQTKFWYDKKGKSYKIIDMNFMHTKNTINYIVEHYPQRTGSKLYMSLCRHFSKVA